MDLFQKRNYLNYINRERKGELILEKLEIYLLEGTLGDLPEKWNVQDIAKFHYSNIMKSLYLTDFPEAWKDGDMKNYMCTIGANDYFNKWTGEEFMPLEGTSLENLYSFVNKELADGSIVEGKKTGLPICGGNHQLLFYNKKYTDKVPETMEELIQFSEEAKKKHNLEYGFTMPTGGVYFILPFLYGFGADLWSTDNEAIPFEPLKKTIIMLKELIYDKKILPVKWEEPESVAYFKEQRSAYCIGGDWNIHEFDEASGHNLGVCEIPKLERECRSTANANYLFVTKHLKPELYENVEKLCKKMLSDEVQTQIMKELYRMPASVNYKMDTSQFDELMIKSYEIHKKAFIMPPLQSVTHMYHVLADMLEPNVIIRDTPEKLAEKVIYHLTDVKSYYENNLIKL